MKESEDLIEIYDDLSKIIEETLQSYLHSQVLLFNGDYRSKEVDIMFGIHPATKVIEELTYEKLLPDGKPYIPDPSTNYTDPINLIERLTLKNALIGI